MMHKTSTSKSGLAESMRVRGCEYGLSDHINESQTFAAFKARSHSSAAAETLALLKYAQPYVKRTSIAQVD